MENHKRLMQYLLEAANVLLQSRKLSLLLNLLEPSGYFTYRQV